MYAWSYAYRAARKGTWNVMALDRDRFKSRIAVVDNEISWCFKPAHRQRMKSYIAQTLR